MCHYFMLQFIIIHKLLSIFKFVLYLRPPQLLTTKPFLYISLSLSFLYFWKERHAIHQSCIWICFSSPLAVFSIKSPLRFLCKQKSPVTHRCYTVIVIVASSRPCCCRFIVLICYCYCRESSTRWILYRVTR